MSGVFSNTTSLMTSVCMLYVGAMAARSYLSWYADKLLKGENQSSHFKESGSVTRDNGDDAAWSTTLNQPIGRIKWLYDAFRKQICHMYPQCSNQTGQYLKKKCFLSRQFGGQILKSRAVSGRSLALDHWPDLGDKQHGELSISSQVISTSQSKI